MEKPCLLTSCEWTRKEQSARYQHTIANNKGHQSDLKRASSEFELRMKKIASHSWVKVWIKRTIELTVSIRNQNIDNHSIRYQHKKGGCGYICLRLVLTYLHYQIRLNITYLIHFDFMSNCVYIKNKKHFSIKIAPKRT